jgi:2-aminoadipate transaminase
VLDRDGPDVLDYFDPATGYEELVFGFRGLRERLVERIFKIQGRKLDPRGLILTSGSVQGISLAVNGYVDPGDVVVVEASSFPYALRFMATAGADVRSVPIDENGMDVDAIETLLAKVASEGKRVKLVYTIPTFQTPTNTEMSLPRRHKLIALAAQHKFIVLEDDIYSDIRFAGERLPSLLSLDKSGLVIQSSSFSKMVVPALRLGWIAGETEAIGALASVRQDLGVGQWLARVMAEYLAQGLLEPHLKQANAIYKSKAAVAVAAVREHCGEFVKFREPRGSFYLWLEIDDRVDWARAAKMAAQEGIFFRPGERFTGEPDGRQFMRLAYSHVSEQVLAEGIKKLGGILRACARN